VRVCWLDDKGVHVVVCVCGVCFAWCPQRHKSHARYFLVDSVCGQARSRAPTALRRQSRLRAHTTSAVRLPVPPRRTDRPSRL
jgi:hypothetical protein